FRTFRQSGVVLDVRPADRVLEVRTAEGGKSVSWTVAGDCQVTLNDEPADLADLHRDDKIAVTHDAPDSKGAEVSSIEATRAFNPRHWALVVGISAYEDAAVTRPSFAAADAQLVAQTLTSRYQTETDHMLVLTDVSRIRLEQSLPAFLDKLPADAELLVFFDAQAYADTQGKIYIAPIDFTLARIDATGVPLAWLIGALEKCPAGDKLLLLDLAHAGKGADLKSQPSTGEMLQTLKSPGALSPLRTFPAIVSSRRGEKSQDLANKEHGSFGWSVAEGLTGRADKNRDNRLEPTELFEFLVDRLQGLEGSAPEMILPDATPARLTPEGKVAIRKLAADLAGRKLNLKQAASDYETAQDAAAGQPEPKLLYALILAKGLKEKDAIKLIDDLKSTQPDLPIALEIDAWLRYRKQEYVAGTADLVQLFTALGGGKAKAYEVAQTQRLLGWAGRLREFAAIAANEQYRPPEGAFEELDAMAEKFPPDEAEAYAAGRKHVRDQARELDKQIAAEPDKSAMLKLQVSRRQLVNYATFPLDAAAKNILAHLDE
ncbi:MAG TPA: hypothetical protein VG433_12385, partial [Pirellulales bacterium]|nr:hypothetical protein [Pirellulales bacterium]